MKAEPKKECWVEKTVPEHLDIVLFAQRLEPIHVGIWIDTGRGAGKILHACDKLGITCIDAYAMEGYGFIKPKYFSYAG